MGLSATVSGILRSPTDVVYGVGRRGGLESMVRSQSFCEPEMGISVHS